MPDLRQPVQCQVLGSGVTWARGCGLFNVVDQIVRLSQE